MSKAQMTKEASKSECQNNALNDERMFSREEFGGEAVGEVAFAEGCGVVAAEGREGPE